MYAKLAIRNVKRSIGDYAVYVLTLVLSITMIFAYNSLLFSDAINSFSKLMRPMMSILICVTVMVVLILGWLISYITHFIFEQRSREFACYMTMGMERSAMSRLFLIEQLVIGSVTLVGGILLGNVFYLALSQVIFKMFDKTYYMDLSFQLPAIGLTILCFFVMFTFCLLKQRRILKKVRIKELMSYSRQNEHVAAAGRKNIRLKMTAAVLLGVLGLLCLYVAFSVRIELFAGFGNMFLMAAGVLLQGASLMLFYRQLAQVILQRYKRSGKRLHHLNIFFYRQLTARLNTNGRQMGVISILLLLTFMGLGGASFMANAYEDALQKKVPFDVEVSQHYGKLDAGACRDFIKEHSKITADLSYDIYYLEDSTLIADMLDRKQEPVEGFEDWAAEENMDRCIRLSDYNKLRSILGKDPVSLQEDEYAIQTEEGYYRDKIEKAATSLKTGGREYRLGQVLEGPFAQDGMNESGFSSKTILVLPDQACETLKQARGCYVAMVDDREKTDYQDALQKTIEKTVSSDGPSFILAYTYQDQKGEMQSIYMMTAFICCYAAFICIFICATILAVQLISSSKKYRYQYDQLRRMGTMDSEIRKLTVKQSAVYFFLPMILPLFFLLLYMAGIGFAFPVQRSMLIASFAGAAGIFLAVYGCYLVITCLQYQRNVLKGTKQFRLHDFIRQEK